MLSKKTSAYLLVLLLLLFSGNPIIDFLFGKYSTIIGLVLVLVIINKNLNIRKPFIKLTGIITGFLVVITIAQYLQFSLVSVLGMINLLLKFVMGGLIIDHLKEKFIPIFFKIVFYLSFISLIFYIVFNISHLSIPHIRLNETTDSYIVYQILEGYYFKNSGMFWEPGAHAGILTLCLALNFNMLTYYWKKHNFKLLVVILALITSQSTTGYIVGAVIIVFYIYQLKTVSAYVFVLPILIAVGFFLYESTDFLKEKIESQYGGALEQEVGELSNTRFGSILFDWVYIKKHPIIGNGLLKETRYADHQYLFLGETGDVVRSGNSFSYYWASFGVFFILGYFYLLMKAFLSSDKLFAFLVLFVVLLNLQGEQWFNYPLYLGLLFFNYKKINQIFIKRLYLRKRKNLVNV